MAVRDFCMKKAMHGRQTPTFWVKIVLRKHDFEVCRAA
jgi:hypothetical protein